jgi:hypothetical protein
MRAEIAALGAKLDSKVDTLREEIVLINTKVDNQFLELEEKRTNFETQIEKKIGSLDDVLKQIKISNDDKNLEVAELVSKQEFQFQLSVDKSVAAIEYLRKDFSAHQDRSDRASAESSMKFSEHIAELKAEINSRPNRSVNFDPGLEEESENVTTRRKSGDKAPRRSLGGLLDHLPALSASSGTVSITQTPNLQSLHEELRLRPPVTPLSCMQFIMKCNEIVARFPAFQMEVIHYIDIAIKLQLAVSIELLFDWNPGDNDAEFKHLLSNEQVFKYLAEHIQPKTKSDFVSMLILYRRFPRLPDGYCIGIHNFEKFQVAARTYIKDFRKLLYWLSTPKAMEHRPALGPLQYLDRTTHASDVNAQKTIMTIFTQGIYGEYGRLIHQNLDPVAVGKLKVCAYEFNGVAFDNLESYFNLFTTAMTEVFTSFRKSHDLGALSFGMSAVSVPGDGKPASRWTPRPSTGTGNRDIQEERPRYNPPRVESSRVFQQSRMPFDQNFDHAQNFGHNLPQSAHQQHNRMQVYGPNQPVYVPTPQEVDAYFAHYGAGGRACITCGS